MPRSPTRRTCSRTSCSCIAAAAMTIEGRAVLANYDAATDLLTVWSATQTPHLARGTLADLLERNLESIRVIAPDVGGGFGTKAPFYAEEAVIPAAAMKLGRPVKWQEDRREHFLCADPGARPVLEGRHRGRRATARSSALRGKHAARHRRLRAVGHHRALHRGDDRSRPLRGAGLQDRIDASCSPTRCRPRWCAAPAGRRRCSRWSG